MPPIAIAPTQNGIHRLVSGVNRDGLMGSASYICYYSQVRQEWGYLVNGAFQEFNLDVLVERFVRPLTVSEREQTEMADQVADRTRWPGFMRTEYAHLFARNRRDQIRPTDAEVAASIVVESAEDLRNSILAAQAMARAGNIPVPRPLPHDGIPVEPRTFRTSSNAVVLTPGEAYEVVQPAPTPIPAVPEREITFRNDWGTPSTADSLRWSQLAAEYMHNDRERAIRYHAHWVPQSANPISPITLPPEIEYEEENDA